MIELETEEHEKKVSGSDSVIVKETRSVEDLPDHVGEDVRNVFPKIGAEEQADNPDEEEIAIVMEIAEVIERGRKDTLPALKNEPKKKLLEETAKVDKLLSKLKTHSTTKTNKLLYPGALVVTNRIAVKIDKEVERKEPVTKRRLQNKMKEFRKVLSQLEVSKDKDISNFTH